MMVAPFHQWVLPNGVVSASFYRTEAGYRLSFPKLAEFDITEDGLHAEVMPAVGVSQSTIEHIYLNQVHPLMLSRQGYLVFHAAAVEVPQGAVAFVGPSGRGKSTLTASFARAGHRFLTDDSLMVEETSRGYMGCPSHPSIRLWEDSRQEVMHQNASLAPAVQHTAKVRVLSDDELGYCDEKRLLRCVYFLGEGKAEDVMIKPVSASEALIELAKNSFLLDTQLHDVIGQHFDELTRLVSRPMYFRLDYPRQYELLSMVHAAVLAHVKSEMGE